MRIFSSRSGKLSWTTPFFERHEREIKGDTGKQIAGVIYTFCFFMACVGLAIIFWAATR